MYSLRKWLYKPKREDPSLLAQFFYADEDLNAVAAELDSFDGRKDPDRCTALVNQLRQSQDKVLSICNQIMEEVISDSRANRDFRVKFPDDVLQESLAGQLWFGAECLAAGSSILNRDAESISMRPLAKLLTKSLEKMRCLLREQCLRNVQEYSDKVKEALCNFDNLFAEFELSYVSAMVPVKTSQEYDLQQNLVVLFSETLQRALHLELLTQEKIDDYDPALMFTIPRLAIVCGLLIYPEGPLNMDVEPHELSEMFRPYHNLLRKIRDLLWTMSRAELFVLEKALGQMEAPGGDPLANAALTSYLSSDRTNTVVNNGALDDVNAYVQQLYQGYPMCKQLVSEFCGLGMFRASSSPVAQAAEGAPQVVMPRMGWQWSVENRNRNRDPLTPERSLRRHQRVAPMPMPAQCPALNSRSRSPSCHSCQSSASSNSATMWDTQSSCGSSTSSYTSEGPDDEEIALALQAAEIANREEARSRFRDSQDLVHRLFVCISGVADQLQSNYASDLRHILKCVFEMNCSQLPMSPPSSASTSPTNSGTNTPTYGHVPESVESAEEASEGDDTSVVSHEHLASNPAPPPWIPDELAPLCMSCVTSFTMLRRRHHCRNCGKVVCGRCSSNSVPLPHYGYSKCVRVCDHCLTFLADS